MKKTNIGTTGVVSLKAKSNSGTKKAGEKDGFCLKKLEKKITEKKYYTEGTVGANLFPALVAVSDYIVYKTTYDSKANSFRLPRKPSS